MHDEIEKEVTPRYFFRRLAAYIFDFCLVTLVLYLFVLLPFSHLSGQHFFIPSIFKVGSCSTVELPKHFQAHLEAIPHPGGPGASENDLVVNVQHCRTKLMLVHRVDTLVIVKKFKPSDSAIQRYNTFHVTLPVDKNLNFASYIDVEPYYYLLLLVYFILFNFFMGSTPGKYSLGLKLVTKNRNYPSLSNSIKREVLRFSPILIIVLGEFIFSLTQESVNLDDPEVIRSLFRTISAPASSGALVLLISNTIAVILAVVFVITWIRWREQILYDRVSGLYVINE